MRGQDIDQCPVFRWKDQFRPQFGLVLIFFQILDVHPYILVQFQMKHIQIAMEWNLVEVIVETTATIRIGFDATFQHFLVIDAFDCRSRQNPQQFEIVIGPCFHYV